MAAASWTGDTIGLDELVLAQIGFQVVGNRGQLRFGVDGRGEFDLLKEPARVLEGRSARAQPGLKLCEEEVPPTLRNKSLEGQRVSLVEVCQGRRPDAAAHGGWSSATSFFRAYSLRAASICRW